MYKFYEETIDDLVSAKVLDKQMKILVLCGSRIDKEILYKRGFENIIISNLDTRMNSSEYTPYKWSFQNAEDLEFEDNSFDFSIIHWGLHHCYSPHRALLEMYRVSRKGILLFEPHDNILTRLGTMLKIGQEYEHSAVFHNDCTYGGVSNTALPNYVYRWTEKEIIKTVNSFVPYGKNRFKFNYKIRIPWTQLRGRKHKIIYYGVLFSLPILKVITFIFPKLSNNFSATVFKPELPLDLHPWLIFRDKEIKLNFSWLKKRYT